MNMKNYDIMKNLQLRGALDFLSSVTKRVTKGHRTSDRDGSYLDPDIDMADGILQLAYWEVQRELDKYEK